MSNAHGEQDRSYKVIVELNGKGLLCCVLDDHLNKGSYNTQKFCRSWSENIQSSKSRRGSKISCPKKHCFLGQGSKDHKAKGPKGRMHQKWNLFHF
uniref:Uncharacterized protein n=1 Tax=Monomastix sp. (strain OKE-1) TaxID=141716 RepID=U5YGH3_MONSK|nr:hypothetical protein [Monomastix sp. OKE-1]AGZ90220.1 hypothetical protein [Monomastix sp. OKE-1]